MANLFKKKEFVGGFTLAEVLIVVVVVGLLASIAIASYSHYRKASLVELAADNIVSQLYEARDSVRLGKDQAEGAFCRGVMFTGLVSAQIQSFEIPYGGKKSWKDGGWADSGCAGEMKFTEFEMDDLVSVKGLYSGDEEIAECGVLFAPPSGELVTLGCGGADSLSVLIQYGTQENYSRLIKIDLINGIANVEKGSEK